MFLNSSHFKNKINRLTLKCILCKVNPLHNCLMQKEGYTKGEIGLEKADLSFHKKPYSGAVV